MLGAAAVGKTSLVARYVRSIFSENYHSTIGVKIDKKSLDYHGRLVNLILWDLYGEDQNQQIQSSYLRGASGYFLIIDGMRPETLHMAQNLQTRIEVAIGKLPFIALINKADLKDSWLIKAQDLAPLQAAGWYFLETSAKSGEGVEEAFYQLTDKMLNIPV